MGLGLGSGALALAALSGHPPVWTLYAVAAVMSALNGLQRPSLEALAPRLVDADEMPAIASLAMLRGSVGMIAGPALGGALLASAGLATTYLFDVATFVCSIFAVRTIRAVLPAEPGEGLTGALDGLDEDPDSDALDRIHRLSTAAYPVCSELLEINNAHLRHFQVTGWDH